MEDLEKSKYGNEVLVALGAVIVTLFMSSGQWDLFDAIISLLLVIITWYVITNDNGLLKNKWIKYAYFPMLLGLVSMGFIIPLMLYFLPKLDFSFIPSAENLHRYFSDNKVEGSNALYPCQFEWQFFTYLSLFLLWFLVVCTTKNKH